MKRILVTGAGGFVGSHLVSALARSPDNYVIGVDINRPAFGPTDAHKFLSVDLRDGRALRSELAQRTAGIDEVYHLAANMGGIGFIESNKAAIVHDNVLISMNVLEAARRAGASRLLFTSSACVYPQHLQQRGAELATGLKEQDAYDNVDPEDGYGWEKLYTERACRHYRDDYGLDTRVARLHNVYGPQGAFQGGREKSPAALCRKIALAAPNDPIEVWGDGSQVRSYCYVADCVEGLVRLMHSPFAAPLNIGSRHSVTVSDLVDLIAAIAGKQIRKVYDTTKAIGVASRSSDNDLVRTVLNWEPNTSLRDGLQATYEWIQQQVRER